MFDFFEQYTPTERELFPRVCRRLLAETFVVSEKDDASRRQYAFIENHLGDLKQYFEPIGLSVYVDTNMRVAMLREVQQENSADSDSARWLHTGHIMLTKEESIYLLCLRILYGDKINSGVLSRNIAVTLPEFIEILSRFNMKDITKNPTRTERVFKKFASYNLIRMTGEIAQGNCRLLLYPSLQFVQSISDMEEWLKTYTGNMLDDTNGRKAVAETDEEDSDEEVTTDENREEDPDNE